MEKMQNQEIELRIATGGLQFGNLMESAAKALITDSNKYRKRVKPEYARFKAKIKYTDGNHLPMFSIDSCNQYKDNEEMGLRVIHDWVVKCNSAGLIDSIQIWMTLNRFKPTNKMEYNTRILFWSSKFNTIEKFKHCVDPRLRFYPNGSVNLERFRNND